MAARGRGKKQSSPAVIVVNAGQNEDETEGKTDEEVQADDEIAEASSEAPRQAEATVWRVDPDSGEKRWAGKVSPAVVTHEFLARRFGAGKFLVQFRKPSPDGRRLVYDSQKWFLVDESAADVQPLPAVRGGPVYNQDGSVAGDPTMQTAQSAALLSFIESMSAATRSQMEQMRQNAQLTLTLVENMTKRSNEPSALLLALAPVIPTLAEKLLGRSDQTMEVVRAVADLMRPRESGGVRETLEVIQLVKEQFGESGGGDSTADLLNKGIGAITSMVNQRRESPPAITRAPMQALPPAPQPQSDMTAPRDEVASPPVALRFPPRLWRQRIRDGLTQLLSFRHFVSPDGAASHYADNASEAEWTDFEQDRALGDVDGLSFVERSVAAILEGHAAVTEADVRWLIQAIQALVGIENDTEPEGSEE